VALVASRYELVRELRVERETVDWEGFDTKLDRAVIVRLLRPELTGNADACERFWQVARTDARARQAHGDQVLDGGTDAETGQPFVVRALPSDAEPRPVAPVRAIVTTDPLGKRFVPSRRWLTFGAVVTVVLVVAALRPGMEAWLAWVNTPAARIAGSFVLPPADGATEKPPSTAVATARSTPATSVPTASPTRAPTPTFVQVVQSRRIVNTDGRGVALRVAPGGDRFPGKGYDEGDSVQAFEQSGEWTRIRGADGREGWVLSVTLAP
jgi:hypothetical protein